MNNVYDLPKFYDYYKSLRKEKINANNLIENPIILSMLPDVKGKRILDLGCGDGNMAKRFIDAGADYVVGIDISENMIKEANENNNSDKIKYMVMGMEEISKINEKFDIVYSSLAFHYIEDYSRLMQDIYNLLNVGGVLIYSQESPLNTCYIIDNPNQDNKLTIDGKKYYLISDYCNETVRENYWNGVKVTKYHRSYATIVNTLIQTNFKILEMKDSYASPEAISLCEKYKNQKDKPYFTFVKAEKI